MRIAIVMPHFPSQTHTFYWREIKALRGLGLQVEPISTTPPPPSEVCHDWSRGAQSQTRYILPVRPGAALAGAARLLLSGPRGWWACLRLLMRAECQSLAERSRFAALIPIGAMVSAMVRRDRIKHLHAHSCGDVAWICLIASRLSGIGYSLTLHGPLEHYGGAQALKWQNARFAIAVTRRLRSEVLRDLPGVDSATVHVASMGVELDQFVRQTPYESARDGETVRVVTCGRLHPGKGHADLIDAVAVLNRRGVSCSLEIMGEGQARSDLERKITEHDLNQIVTLRGAVGESEVRETLERAHVFALASHDEAIGVATMEAMAMELPVVATSVGGVPELIDHRVNGLLVAPRQPGQLADAILTIARDPSLATRLGSAAREAIVERFGSDVSARVIASELGVTPPTSEKDRREQPCAS